MTACVVMQMAKLSYETRRRVAALYSTGQSVIEIQWRLNERISHQALLKPTRNYPL